MSWDGPGPHDRLLVLAPHPDDETLSAGGLLQRVLARGGSVCVVFATDGENNPWTQRLVERRLRVGPEDCVRFGRKRREEAMCALSELGVPSSDAVFLGFSDQAITSILLSRSAPAVERLAALLHDRRPTLVVAPSPFDLHPDHSALAVLLDLALQRMDAGARPRLFSYVIHASRRGRRTLSEDPAACVRFEPEAKERARKERAIRCHATQLAVHQKKFLSYASRPEVFFPETGAQAARSLHPVRRARVGPATLRLDLVLRPRPGAFGRPTLRLASGNQGERSSLSLDLRWRRGGADVKDALTRETTGRAELRGGRLGGTVEVPLAALPKSRRLYVKIERQFGFFDEGGWLEVDTDSQDDS
jgi:N-acetyl-1-D-myo-inositol-2-amino-2-deoxy-alpha-D-glucopyranoside deacetylase